MALSRLCMAYLLFAICRARPTTDDNSEISTVNLKTIRTLSELSGKILENYDPNIDLVNPEEMGEYAEGDILILQTTRNGLIDKTKRWKDGIIPYEIDSSLDQNYKLDIEEAMEHYHKHTCIKFRPKTADDKNYLYITGKKSGCWSNVGMIGGKQMLNLQVPACFRKRGTVIHELMHAVGFFHEQNRWERDGYVTIAWENVAKGREVNFLKFNQTQVFGYDVTYDYNSVMHYSARAFSRNNKPTIITKVQDAKIGQREGFSKGDITKILTMYNCPNKKNENEEDIYKPDKSDDDSVFSFSII